MQSASKGAIKGLQSTEMPATRSKRQPLLSQEAYLYRIERRNQRERTAILIVWALLVCWVILLTLSPANSALMQSMGQLGVPHRVGHFFAYISVSIPPVIGCRRRRQGLMLAALMVLMGILLELGQHFSPGRHPSFWDAMTNAGGVACGITIARPIRSRMAIY